MEKYDVNVVGLTLSKNQQAYCNELLSKVDTERTFDVRLEGWEQFHQPGRPHRLHRGVRALRIRALRRLLQELLRHPARRRPDDHPEQCRLSPDTTLVERGKKLTFELARFIKFMASPRSSPAAGCPTTAHDGRARPRRPGSWCPSRCPCATTTSRRSASGRHGWSSNKDAAIARRRRGELRTATCGTLRMPVLLPGRMP